MRVRLDTTLGSLSVELYDKHAPRTCANFAELTRRGYYNGVEVHRLIAGFMLQTGDPTGTGRGGDSIYGGGFADEFHRELKHTGAGVLSMVGRWGGGLRLCAVCREEGNAVVACIVCAVRCTP